MAHYPRMRWESATRLFVVWTLSFCIGLKVQADVLENWTTNQITTNSFGFHHIVYTNGIYVAIGQSGDSGGYYTSSDGSHWQLQYSEPNSWGANLKYSNGRYCSVGPSLGDGVANVSTNGTNWTTTLFSYSTPAPHNDITYGNGVYVIVGSTNNVASILTSADGLNWVFRAASSTPGGSISSIAYGAGIFVALGNNDGVAYTSSTGTGTWTKRSIQSINKVSYANGLFIAPFNSKTNMISVNGATWSAAATDLTNALGSVVYANGLYFAQCGLSASGSFFATSIDGTNWFQYAVTLPNNCAIYDTSDYDLTVATDGTRLVTFSTSLSNSVYYNTAVHVSDPLVCIRATDNAQGKVAISGLVGRNYQIQTVTDLSGTASWQTNATLQLTNTPVLWTDTNATNAAKFYRGVLLP